MQVIWLKDSHKSAKNYCFLKLSKRLHMVKSVYMHVCAHAGNHTSNDIKTWGWPQQSKAVLHSHIRELNNVGCGWHIYQMATNANAWRVQMNIKRAAKQNSVPEGYEKVVLNQKTCPVKKSRGPETCPAVDAQKLVQPSLLILQVKTEIPIFILILHIYSTN